VRTNDLHNTFISQVQEHKRMIYKVCYLYAGNETDREDLYQEIIAQLWKAYPKFRGDAKFSTWLYQVALNTAITSLRKEKRSLLVHTDDGSLPDRSDQDTDRSHEQLEILNNAITQLNAIEKALVMLYLDDKTYEEMENIMGIAGGTLRVKMTRIKEKLKKITKNY